MEKETKTISLYSELNNLIKRKDFYNEMINIVNQSLEKNNIEILKIKQVVEDLEQNTISPKVAKNIITQIFDNMKSRNVSKRDIEIYQKGLIYTDKEILSIMNQIPYLLDSKGEFYNNFINSYYNYSKIKLHDQLLKYQNKEQLDYDTKVELYNKIISYLNNNDVTKNKDINEILNITSKIFSDTFSENDYETLLLFYDRYEKKYNHLIKNLIILIIDFVKPQESIIRKKNKK